MIAHRRVSGAPGVCLGFGLVVASCVSAQPQDPLGSSTFVASAQTQSDYVARLPAGSGAAAASGGPAAGQTGTVGSPVAMPVQPGAMTGPVVAGARASGAIAAGAAGIQGSSGAPPAAGTRGVAGMPAAGSGMTAGMTGATAGAAGSAMPSTAAGTLTLDFTTVDLDGQYAPRNIGAVWIETASGTFVKTLERWAGIRANHLTTWAMASGGWGSIFGGGNTADQMDAVSRATLRTHGAHHVTWNMKDVSGTLVADGAYNVMIEVTDDERRPSRVAMIAFAKGQDAQQVTAPDMPPYTSLTLSYQP
ncbi:MAG: DUF2271 domain-containing protein [Polyangiales bacterium]